MDTKALRQKILDLAIRGKLVPQDTNDEPASVLLEKIREQKQQMFKEGKLKKKDIKNDSIIFKGEDNLHYEKFQDGTVKCIEDEIPFELPEGWAWERLSNLALFSGGKTPSTSHSEYWDGDILWVTSKDMKSKYITSSQLCLSTLGAKQMRIYQPNTLLLVTRSGILRHTLPVAILKECATINQDLKAIVLYMPQLAEYIYVCLKGMEARLLLKYIKSGTTVESVNFDEFQKVLLPIPPTQQIDRIISSTGGTECIVSTIEDSKVALADYVTKAKAKVLDLAIRGKLVPQNPDDEPASILLERIRAEKEELIKQGKIKRDKKESIIFKGEDNSYYEKIGDKIENIDDEIPFELPDGWGVVRLKELWELISGRDLSPSEYNTDGVGIPYITGASNFVGGKVELVRWTTSPQVITEIGDLLLTCKGTIGEMAFNDFGSAHIARQIMAIRNKFTLNSEYLALCMGFYINAIKNAAKGLIPGISREDILNLILPVPALNYQAKVVERVVEVTNILSSLEKSLS